MCRKINYMDENYYNREYLIIGATGMLYDFSQSISPENLVIACRFESNQNNLAFLDENIAKIRLDYKNKYSKNNFINEIKKYSDLKYAILWIHSGAYDFSLKLMKTLKDINKNLEIVHLFSSSTDTSIMEEFAKQNSINFTAIKLGRVELGDTWRWMTNKEISDKTREVIDNLPKKINKYN